MNAQSIYRHMVGCATLLRRSLGEGDLTSLGLPDNLAAMKKHFLSVGALILMASLAVAQSQPAKAAPALPEPTLKIGDKAPDFTLLDQNRKEVKLSDFRGKKNVVLAFYVFAFTGG
jgi:hypothetical protein